MKKKLSSFGKVCWVLAAVFLLLLPWTALAQQGEPTDGPPRPAPRLPAAEVERSLSQGYLEPDVDAPTVQSIPVTGMALDAAPMALPNEWDWRTEGGGRVTSAKDQGGCGSCYSFGAIGNIEAKMLMDGEGTFDFSENNVKECNWRELTGYESPPGTPWGSCDGGNYPMLIQLLAEGGTVLEADDPYVDSDVSCNSSVTYQKTLLDWRIISGSTMPDTDVLKWYLYTYGPIAVSMYADDTQGFDSGYDGTWTFEYAGPSSAPFTNHAVLLVGWSDDLPGTPSDPGNPADGWIVKNSWGTSWGDNGYFYAEYGAANVGLNASFMYDWQDYDPDGGVLDYVDDYGWTTAWGCGDGTDWGMVRFTPPADTYATNIEFWTTDITTTVDVYLYDTRNGNNFEDLLAQSTGHVYPESGYHSVLLSSPVQLTNGDDVFAVIRFSNGGGSTTPVAGDRNGTIETGRTYLSCSGPGSTWYDLGVQSTPTNTSIRLRTSTCPKTYPSLTVGSDETFTLSCDITVEGDLEVQSGGALDLGTHDITVTGSMTNSGTITQTKVVSNSVTTEFLHITDRAGTTGKYFGVDILPTSGDMGSTTVSIQGNQACPSTSGSTVLRCFEITPGTVQTATVTFYYRDAEENGQTTPYIWHWTGSEWEQEALGGRDLTGVENNWIQATGVDAYSPFAADNGNPTAVTLASFEAAPSGAAVLVTWETVMEIDNVGFNLYRSESPDGPYVKLNESLIPSQAPGVPFGAEYAWLDETVEPGVTYYYKLEDIDVWGTSTFHGPVSVSQGPNAVSLAALDTQGGPLVAVLAGSLLFGIVGLALVRRARRRD